MPDNEAIRAAELWFDAHGLPYFVESRQTSVRVALSRGRLLSVGWLGLGLSLAAGVGVLFLTFLFINTEAAEEVYRTVRSATPWSCCGLGIMRRRCRSQTRDRGSHRLPEPAAGSRGLETVAADSAPAGPR
ncbi:MAG: hypothetical protein ABJA86_04500 [Nocardioidaceae bacterium]